MRAVHDRRRGALTGEDEAFPIFDGWDAPCRRCDIEEFDLNDAQILLDGDGSYEACGDAGHGYHRYGLGLKKAEFPAGWDEPTHSKRPRHLAHRYRPSDACRKVAVVTLQEWAEALLTQRAARLTTSETNYYGELGAQGEWWLMALDLAQASIDDHTLTLADAELGIGFAERGCFSQFRDRFLADLINYQNWLAASA